MKAKVKFKWTGDLSDDCFCRVGSIAAHCEAMDDVTVKSVHDRDKFKSSIWYFSVCRVNRRNFKVGDDIFHTGEHAGSILTGDMARALAEAIMLPAIRRKRSRPKAK